MENQDPNLHEKKVPTIINPRAHGAGRRTGTPNKSTTEAKHAIALFVESNAHRLQEWLDMIAHGYATIDESGNQKIMQPNPQKAYELFMGVVEYHIPKLTRAEIKATIDTSDDFKLSAKTPEDAAREYSQMVQ